jgi:hypothetical protein
MRTLYNNIKEAPRLPLPFSSSSLQQQQLLHYSKMSLRQFMRSVAGFPKLRNVATKCHNAAIVAEEMYITDSNGFPLSDIPISLRTTIPFANRTTKNPVDIVDSNGFPVVYNLSKHESFFMTDTNGMPLMEKPISTTTCLNKEIKAEITDAHGFPC